MTGNILKSQAFKLKGRLYTLTVLQLLTNDLDQLSNQLTEAVSQAPKMFDKTPIILDFSTIHDESIDFQGLLAILKEHGLIAIAQQGGNPIVEVIAVSHGLPTLNASAAHDKPLYDRVEETPTEFTHTETIIRSKTWTTPVRSGQQVVSQGGDLVIAASVSHGAELLSDGNIHVYGTLRGRALAGITGDKQARIFCLNLEAELVSIAGIYRLSDAIEPVPGPCQLFIQDDHLHIEPIKMGALRLE